MKIINISKLTNKNPTKDITEDDKKINLFCLPEKKKELLKFQKI